MHVSLLLTPYLLINYTHGKTRCSERLNVLAFLELYKVNTCQVVQQLNSVEVILPSPTPEPCLLFAVSVFSK